MRRDIVASLLSWCIVGSAWLSMSPYFIWDRRQPFLLAAAVAAGIAGAVAWRTQAWRLPEPRDLIAGAALFVFLVYISLQQTVAGDHAWWVFVVPTLLALLVMPVAGRALTYQRFELVFLVSLVPGLLLSILMILGVELTYTSRAAPNALFAAAGVRMLEGPGAVFIESNSQSLPWGGFISRLCGMYDEPGMVGTLAALMLAVRGFDVTGPRAILLWVAGILSLSLAFVVLTLGGLTLRAVATRRVTPLFWSLPIVATGLFVLGVLKPAPAPPHTATNVQVEQAPGIVTPVQPQNSIRQTESINNRSMPEMDALVEEYRTSAWRTVMFGIASDASVVYGGASAVWTRVLTNHGLVGMVLLVAAFAGYAVSSLRRTHLTFAALMFFGAFALSFYQRPVIWLPYNLLIFFGAAALLESRRSNERPSPLQSPASARPAS